MTELMNTAEAYYEAGLNVLPTRAGQKAPFGAWQDYRYIRISEEELQNRFNAAGSTRFGVICGVVSGNLEVLDFDWHNGCRYEAWRARLPEEARKELDNCNPVIERSQNGGIHIAYRCNVIDGNKKLAMVASEEGKPECIIETRGEGGFIVCAPSEGYEIVSGDWTNLPEISEELRAVMLNTAVSFNEVIDNTDKKSNRLSRKTVTRIVNFANPLDHFAAVADIGGLLHKHGWQYSCFDGTREHWIRPGKAEGVSANLMEIDGTQLLYVFSSNADPFEPGRAYNAASVITLLEFDGNFREASNYLRTLGFGVNSNQTGTINNKDKQMINLMDKLTEKEVHEVLTTLGVKGSVAKEGGHWLCNLQNKKESDTLLLTIAKTLLGSAEEVAIKAAAVWFRKVMVEN